MDIAFQYDHYLVKKQLFALTGIVRIYNPQDQLVLYCQQKIFKLKEDIRIYADETKNHELLNIKARQIIDFSAYYDVFDSQYLTKIGGLRRKGLRSFVQDEWEVIDPQDQLIGILKEDTLNKALLRRFLLGRLLPQNYDLEIGTERIADYKQRFHLFRYELEIDFLSEIGNRFDHRLGLAVAILLAIIEGRQHAQS
jgi:uncharacterized protein YxjI